MYVPISMRVLEDKKDIKVNFLYSQYGGKKTLLNVGSYGLWLGLKIKLSE